MRVSQVHIGGVAVARIDNGAIGDAAIAAATRAMLDAGVTYTDIDQSIACFQDDLRIPATCFDAFGLEAGPVVQTDNNSGLFTAVQYIRSRQSNSTLVLGFDSDALGSAKGAPTLVVGFVLVSDFFLTSHAYLKDGAIRIAGHALVNQIYSRTLGGSDPSRTARTAVSSALRQAQLKSTDVQLLHLPRELRESNPRALSGFDAATSELSKSIGSEKGTAGLAVLATLVWQFRGWAGDLPLAAHNCLLYTSGPGGAVSVVVLGRSDGRAALKWEEVQNVRDGRERLGYNPAVETRDICIEDLRAVRARIEFVPAGQKQIQLPVKGGDRAALARL